MIAIPPGTSNWRGCACADNKNDNENTSNKIRKPDFRVERLASKYANFYSRVKVLMVTNVNLPIQPATGT